MNQLSETELAARFPVVAVGIALLFLVGVVADVYVLLWWARARQERRRLQQVPAKPWDLLFIVVATVLLLTVSLVAEAVTLFSRHRDEARVVAALLVDCALLASLFWYFRREKITWPSAFGLHDAPTTRAAGTGALLYLALVPPLFLLTITQERLYRAIGWKASVQPIADLVMTTGSPSVFVLLLLLALVVAPVFEEVFFRGLVYPALKQRLGVRHALLIMSAAFALIHMHVPSFLPLFGLALGLGLAYEVTGSLVAPIVLHALFNAANVTLLLYARAHP